MRHLYTSLLFAAAIAACSPSTQAPDTPPDTPKQSANELAGGPKHSQAVHHDVSVKVDPAKHTLQAIDTVTIPATLAQNGLKFSINSDLKLSKIAGDVNLKLVAENRNAGDLGMDRDNESEDTVVKIDVYEIHDITKGQDTKFTVELNGEINNPIRELGQEYSRGFSSTPGLVEPRGVYLAGATYWVPTVEDTLMTYDLTVKLPEGWSSVSQGERKQNKDENGLHIDEWDAPTPTEEIYVIGAKFTQYERPIGNVKAMAFLRTPDPALADKYLETTAQYMDMYRELIGPYPYTKFALVENFWETGYGMPSFTLLGSQIIRFPFILHSSYPHELLHNWWGNSVYIDFDTGNWAEGLTAYMADHLVAESRGQGADHRRSILQRYTSYVDDSTDFPLTQFVGRTDAPTEAIGYGKTAMVFDMLREKVGDENFKRALAKFYREHKYKVGKWDDIRLAFEDVSGEDLSQFFNQWVAGVGAPELAIEKAGQDGDILNLIVKQVQNGQAYVLDVPVAVYTKDKVFSHKIHMDGKSHQTIATLPINGEVVRVEIDPAFNVFRKLHWAEIPPSLGAAFGADKVLLVVPANDKTGRYTKLAKLWSGRENVKVIKDTDLETLPKDAAIWVLSTENRFYDQVKSALKNYDASVTDSGVKFGKKSLKRSDNSTIIAVRNPNNPEAVIVGLTIHSDAATAGLARKLPHYGKYSYLAFTGDAPTNSAKGQWPAVGSPLVAVLKPGVPTTVKLPKRPALATLKPTFNGDVMMDVVKTLSSKPYEGRGVGTKGLDKAANYVRDQFKKAGLQPGGTDGYFQPFMTDGPDGKKVEVKNIIGIIPGKNPKFDGQSVVLTAHYDHLGYGWPGVRDAYKNQMHPGADDNASGVAVLLAVAKSLAKSAPERTIIIAAVTAEEAGLIGARHYVKNAGQYPANKIFANVNLDTVGSAKDKFMVFGGGSAREWPFIFMGTTATTGIKTELVAQAVNASDHTAFLEANIPAIHIFGAPTGHYHRPSDTADTINVGSLMRAAVLTKEVVGYLAERPEPMTNQITKDDQKAGESVQPKRKGRTVSTGTMPDFAFSGEGVKVGGVAPDSPGAKAGLKAGDVITSFGGVPVKNLREYTNELGKYKPGDTVKIIVERAGETHNLELTLAKR